MVHVLLALAALAYCAAATGYVGFLVGAMPGAARTASTALLVGLLLHGGAVVTRAVQYGFTPAMQLQEGLSVLAWFIGLTYFFVNQRLKLPILGAFVVPLMLVVALPALSLPGPPQPLSPQLRSVLLPLHVTAALLGLAAFGVAALVGVAFLMQERQLKARHTLSSLWAKLPSLELMDCLNRALTVVGFALLTVTIVTGAFFARSVWGHVFSLSEPNEVMAVVTWLVYGALVAGRLRRGWSGRRAAVLTLAGFVLAMVSFIGLSFCPVDRHVGSFL